MEDGRGVGRKGWAGLGWTHWVYTCLALRGGARSCPPLLGSFFPGILFAFCVSRINRLRKYCIPASASSSGPS